MGGTWSGDATKGKDYGLYADNQVITITFTFMLVASMHFCARMSSFQVTIALGDEASSSGAPVERKEKPIWMIESTIEGASSENNIDDASERNRQSAMTSSSGKSSKESDAIMQALLAHEKKRNRA